MRRRKRNDLPGGVHGTKCPTELPTRSGQIKLEIGLEGFR